MSKSMMNLLIYDNVLSWSLRAATPQIFKKYVKALYILITIQKSIRELVTLNTVDVVAFDAPSWFVNIFYKNPATSEDQGLPENVQ